MKNNNSYDFVDIYEIESPSHSNSKNEINDWNFINTDENSLIDEKITKRVEFTYVNPKSIFLQNQREIGINTESINIETTTKKLPCILEEDVREKEIFNHKAFIKHTISSFFILLIIVILLKAFQSAFGKFCFQQLCCDCTDESIGIKLWSAIMVYIIQAAIIIMTYMRIQEVYKKSIVYCQLLFNGLVIGIGAILMSGNIDILSNFRMFSMMVNHLVVYIFALIHLGNWESLKIDLLGSLFFIAFNIVIAFFPLLLQLLTHIPYVGSVVAFNFVIVFGLYYYTELLH